MADEIGAAGRADPAGKESLLRLLDETRARFEAALAAVSDVEAPLRDDGWSAKDILGHVTAWERRLARGFAAGLRGETPVWPDPVYTAEQMDALNSREREARRGTPFAQVMEEARASYVDMRRMIEPLSERELFEPGVYAWTEEEPLSAFIKGDTWEHYEEHAADLEAAREPQG